MTLDELREAVADGTVDTVLLGFCDMQGRLQGKRLVADAPEEEFEAIEKAEAELAGS